MEHMLRTGALLFLLVISLFCRAQPAAKSIAVGFYNCENFFDTVDDPQKDDDEFTPKGKFRYTNWVYKQKQRNIARVVQSMGEQNLAMLGMAEVENKTVLNDLVHQKEISKKNYRYVWYSGNDPRGINVALLYDPSLFTVISSESIPVDLSGTTGKVQTRNILHVCGTLQGDTVDVLVNHWPSRRGDEEQSSAKRSIAAGVAKQTVRQILERRPRARIIIMGDFNDNPADASITKVLGAGCEPGIIKDNSLVNPYCRMFGVGVGTEVYQHQWNTFDQIIVSGSLLKRPGNLLYIERAEIYKPEFLVDTYKGYEGEPHRSFKGTKWINGYSDHFPVMIYLKK